MSLGKPLTSFQVDLISDGDRYWLVNHARKSVQTGKCENIVGVENDKIPLRPMDIVDAYFLREITDQPGFARRITFQEYGLSCACSRPTASWLWPFACGATRFG